MNNPLIDGITSMVFPFINLIMNIFAFIWLVAYIYISIKMLYERRQKKGIKCLAIGIIGVIIILVSGNIIRIYQLQNFIIFVFIILFILVILSFINVFE